MTENIIKHGKVNLGAGTVVEENVVLGHLEDGLLIIGENSLIRSGTIIYSNVKIGNNFKTGHHVTVRENTEIGDNVLIGTNSVVDGNCKIGRNVSVQTNVYITAYTSLEDDVFMGPCSVTTNDKYMQVGAKLKGPLIKKGAKIGANSTILPAIIIGEQAVVGSGAVVTHDVPGKTTVVGNPARQIKGKA